MVHRRDRIPVRHAKEISPRVAFRMVLHQRHRSTRPRPHGPPRVFKCSLKKRHRWRPRSLEEEDSAEVSLLLGKIKALSQSGLSIIKVMVIPITRGIQPLQYRGLLMWHYNGEDDTSCYSRKGPKTPAALAKILAELYKGEKEEFTRLQY